MTINKTVLNHFQLLELLKWHTDKEHPLTQNSLRKIDNDIKLNCIGEKKTFRNRLATLATFYNSDEHNKHLFYHGVNQDIDSASTQKGIHTRGIYYEQDISTAELDFIIHQIESSIFIENTRKKIITERLIHILGNKFYYERYREQHLKMKTSHFFTNEVPQSYFSKIDYAIRNNKMLTFQMAILDKNGKLTVPNKKVTKKSSLNNSKIKHAPKSGSTQLIVSPYNIILYRGTYFLIGNRRLSYNPRYKTYFYSKNFEVFRMDRIYNLDFECSNNSKNTPTTSKTFYNKQQALVDNNIMIYKNGVSIPRNQISTDYGIIKFKILWNQFSDCFPFIEKNDYTFIQDTFGKNYTIEQDDIICVHTCEDCFIDWALVYINRIEIQNDGELAIKVKEKLKKILLEGLTHL